MPPDEPNGQGPAPPATPDAQWVTAWIARSWRHWRIESLALAGAAGGAAALAAWGLRLSPSVAVFTGLVMLAITAWRLPGLRDAGPLVSAAERESPALHNALRAWHEAPPDISTRVAHHLAAQVRRSLTPARRPHPTRWWQWAAVALLTALGGVLLLRTDVPPRSGGIDARPAPTTAASASAPLSWSVTITPPAYTGRPTTRVTNPQEVRVIAGTTLVVAVQSLPSDATLRLGATTVPSIRDGAAARSRLVARDSDVLLIEGRDGRVLASLALVVQPDAAPRVRITAPATDLRRDVSKGTVAIAVTAEDDIGLRDLRLRFTRVSGSGESFTFEDGEWPLAVVRRASGAWTGTYTLDLATLALGPGDSVVYHALAHDARPGREGAAESERFLIEIARSGAQAAGDFSLPEPEEKFALSQRMVIQLTERLLEKRPRMRAEEFREQAQALAAAQRSVRAEFVFMLGGEVEDEFEEAAHSHEVEAGRLDNRGQSDLTEAVRQMSQAERRLTDADLREALPYEYKALAHLQAAFGKARYFMRTLPTPVQIDTTRRLTGDREGLVAAAWGLEPLPDASRARALHVLARLEREAGEVSADLLGTIVALESGRQGWVAQVQEARSRAGRAGLAALLRRRLASAGPTWFAVPLARSADEGLAAGAR